MTAKEKVISQKKRSFRSPEKVEKWEALRKSYVGKNRSAKEHLSRESSAYYILRGPATKKGRLSPKNLDD